MQFSCAQTVFTAFVLCSLNFFELKVEGQTVYRKPHRNVLKYKSNFGISLILGKLNRALRNPSQGLYFKA